MWRFLAITLIPLLMQPRPVLAGAWTLERETGQAIFVNTATFASRGFDSSGTQQRIEDFTKIETTLFIEYGWRDYLTLSGQFEGVHKQIGPLPGDTRTGAGRQSVGARVRVWRDDYAVASLQGMARFAGTRSDYRAAIGDTDMEFDLRALYGRGFSALGRHAFMDAQAAYRVRLGDPADEAKFDLTLGIDATPKLAVVAQSFNTRSVGAGKGGFTRTQEHKAALSLVWRRKDGWATQIGVIATVAGRSALAERGGFVNTWYSF